VAIATQQNAKIIEPSDDALEFDPVYEKNRERDFVFPDMIEKGVLEILSTLARHRSCLASPSPPILANGAAYMIVRIRAVGDRRSYYRANLAVKQEATL
jgi:hypothetical protein